MRRMMVLSVVLLGGLFVGSAWGADAWVSGLVPDWDQPYDYPDAFDVTGPGPDPNPGVVDPWNAWCTPTSGAMMMGHWADVKGVAGTGDASADGNQAIPGGYGGVGWGGGASWHDYTADAGRPPVMPGPPPVQTDIGWYMNTNGTGDANLLPGAHTGTYVGDTAAGLNNFLTHRGSVLAGNAATMYINVAADLGPVLNKVKTEIDANRTVLGHFKWWVNPQPVGANNSVGGEENELDFGYNDYEYAPTGPDIPGDEEYNFQDGEEGLGHTVAIVGYSDDGFGNVTHLITHDNWTLTGRNVRVQAIAPPLSAITTLVPEPATLVMLGLSGLAWVRRRRA